MYKDKDTSTTNNAKGNTAFHLAKSFLNERYEIYENIINGRFFARSIDDDESTFIQLNESNLYIDIQEAGIKLSMDNLFHILKSDFTIKVNPIKQYFENLPKWDKQTDHIKEFTSYIKAINNDWLYTQLKKWLVRVVKCIFIEKYVNKQALIFAQQGQNSGKTTLCRFFCPKELNDYKKEHLDNLKSKDTKIEIARNFLINLDELAIINKYEDMKSLKALMSADCFNERLPYTRSEVVLYRMSSFIGSTDNFDFLKDKTGNVRWLVIELESGDNPINFEYSKKINIDNIWSQAYSLSLDDTFKEEMTIAEIKQNETNNEKFFVADSVTEIIQKELEVGIKNKDDFMTSTDILEYLGTLQSSYLNLLKNVSVDKLGRSLSQMKFIKSSGVKMVNKKQVSCYGYYVKKLANLQY